MFFLPRETEVFKDHVDQKAYQLVLSYVIAYNCVWEGEEDDWFAFFLSGSCKRWWSTKNQGRARNRWVFRTSGRWLQSDFLIIIHTHTHIYSIFFTLLFCPRVFQEILDELDKLDLRYTWHMIKSFLTLLYLDFQTKYTDTFSGFAWR